jgi:hypothetical protein
MTFTDDIFMQLGFSLSNWQKVQLTTDLLKHRMRYWYTKRHGQLKLNEIKKKAQLKGWSSSGGFNYGKRLRKRTLKFYGKSPKYLEFPWSYFSSWYFKLSSFLVISLILTLPCLEGKWGSWVTESREGWLLGGLATVSSLV